MQELLNKRNLQIFFFIVICITIGLFLYYDLQIWLKVENIELVKEYFLKLGIIAPFYMILIYILFNLAAIPRVFFTIFSGYVFGLYYGFLFAWLATMVGLIVTFISIRYLFKERFEEKFGKTEIVEKLNQQIEKRGVFIVIFLRAIYVVPSSILNYSFGFTKIKTSTYLIGSAIGFIPVVLINVYAGFEISRNLSSENRIDFTRILIIAAIIAIIILLIKKLLNNMKLFTNKAQKD